MHETNAQVESSYTFGGTVEATQPLKNSANEHYEENGFYVCRGLVPVDSIDRLLQRYRDEIVPSNYRFSRQTTGKYESNELTEYGYVKQSFIDIHDYQKFPDFSRYARDIFTSPQVRNALKDVTRFTSFNLMQTMLFDANAETVPHQDCWYLDTVPNGHLLGAWFALEDIDERAGRFYVLPKSFNVDLHSDTPGLSQQDWLKRVADYVARHQEQIHAPALKKGDVLFWNSRTIHGSLATQDPRFSRKSLTAHYMPVGFKFGNIFSTRADIVYKTYNGMQFYRTQPDYTPLIGIKMAIKNSPFYPESVMKLLRNVQSHFKALRSTQLLR